MINIYHYDQIQPADGQTGIGFGSQDGLYVMNILDFGIRSQSGQHARLNIVREHHPVPGNLPRDSDAVETGARAYITHHHARTQP